ncbi:hypothetical protein GCM10023187_02640 [Nibrella viscosa]|uniref:Uncharacterized protein n=1 Tax=Nibrella viscosa TaxID=1084524 RepID=A0ABP8JSM4_9BACT
MPGLAPAQYLTQQPAGAATNHKYYRIGRNTVKVDYLRIMQFIAKYQPGQDIVYPGHPIETGI